MQMEKSVLAFLNMMHSDSSLTELYSQIQTDSGCFPRNCACYWSSHMFDQNTWNFFIEYENKIGLRSFS